MSKLHTLQYAAIVTETGIRYFADFKDDLGKEYRFYFTREQVAIWNDVHDQRQEGIEEREFFIAMLADVQVRELPHSIVALINASLMDWIELDENGEEVKPVDVPMFNYINQ